MNTISEGILGISGMSAYGSVAPAATFLAHQSCELNGEVLCVGSGKVSWLAVVESARFTATDLSVEDVSDNLAKIMDTTDAMVRGFLGN